MLNWCFFVGCVGKNLVARSETNRRNLMPATNCHAICRKSPFVDFWLGCKQKSIRFSTCYDKRVILLEFPGREIFFLLVFCASITYSVVNRHLDFNIFANRVRNLLSCVIGRLPGRWPVARRSFLLSEYRERIIGTETSGTIPTATRVTTLRPPRPVRSTTSSTPLATADGSVASTCGHES